MKKRSTIIFLFALLSTSIAFSQKKQVRDSLKQALTLKVEDSVKIATYLNLIKTYFPKEIDSAAYYGNEMLQYSETRNYTKGTIRSQILLAKVDRAQKKNDEGFKRDSLAYQMALTIKDTSLMRNGLIGMTKYYATIKNFIEAKKYGLQTLAISGDGSNTPVNKQIEIAITQSYIYKSLEEYEASIAVLLPLIDHLDNPKVLDIRKQEINTKLAETYELSKNYEKGLTYFKDALDYTDKTNILLKEVQLLINIGTMYDKLDSIPQAKNYNLKAYELIKDNKPYAPYKPFIASRLGYNCMKLKDYDCAYTNFNRILEYGKETQNNFVIANAYVSLGEVLMKQNKVATAQKMLNDSKKLYSKELYKTNPNERITVYEALITIDTLQNRYNKSTFENQMAHFKLKDSLDNKKAQQKIANLELQYRATQKDEKIKLLAANNEVQQLQIEKEKDNVLKLSFIGFLLLVLGGLFYYKFYTKQKALRIIDEQKKELEARNRENELLTQEMHHRVKNNLQIIMTLLSSSSKKNKLAHNEVNDILMESQNKIKTMALIHQDLYASKEKGAGEILASSYFANLITNIKESYTIIDEFKVAIHHKFEDIKVPLSIGVPLGLIVNELLTNAIKYAFKKKDGNEIDIAFAKAENQDALLLKIKDNGIGFEKETTENGSFGIMMVRGLVDQLDGRLSIQHNDGVAYEIIIPNQ
ncbi:sensor histidine kinase [Winogradskyella maritima]|uniref:histidine kinase n=1 Tax=Winogradskyella maritima TaxID=1517766 RepID=A0ABV8AJH1_9FLAO|nr:sensor histidine kinase [Winogradskyella maritima]